MPGAPRVRLFEVIHVRAVFVRCVVFGCVRVLRVCCAVCVLDVCVYESVVRVCECVVWLRNLLTDPVAWYVHSSCALCIVSSTCICRRSTQQKTHSTQHAAHSAQHATHDRERTAHNIAE